jgi:hypothetical protein
MKLKLIKIKVKNIIQKEKKLISNFKKTTWPITSNLWKFFCQLVGTFHPMEVTLTCCQKILWPREVTKNIKRKNR